MIEMIISYWLVVVVLIATVEIIFGNLGQRASARRRWPANFALIVFAAGMSAAIPLSSIVAASWAKSANFGVLNLMPEYFVVTFIVSLLCLSLWDYSIHVASHKIPFLWRFHKIHHSDVTLDVTTTYRVHPLMQVILSAGHVLFVVMLGLSPSSVVIYTLTALMIDVSHHTTFRLPSRLDQALRPFIITPALHHLHHSDHVSETDTNYGRDLALWDKVFGTYRATSVRPPEEFRYGLKQFPQKRADDLHALLLAPFKKD